MLNLKSIISLKRRNLLLIVPLIALLIYLLFANSIFDSIIKVKGESRISNISLPDITSSLRCNIDDINNKKVAWKYMALFSGWSIAEGQNTDNNITYIVLESSDKRYIFSTSKAQRHDVTTFFNDGKNYDNSGFIALINHSLIENGIYKVGVCIENNDAYYFNYCNVFVTKNDDGFYTGFISTKSEIVLPAAKTKIKKSIDIISDIEVNENKCVDIKGWAFSNLTEAAGQTTYIVLASDQKSYVFDTGLMSRPDVTETLGEGTNLDNTGFEAIIPYNAIDSEKYKIGIYIKTGDKEYYDLTDKVIEN